MATQTFHGSCHCKRLQYEADIDLDQGTDKCNCSYCWKVRNWSARIKPEQFRWISGEAESGGYGFQPGSKNAHVFCKNCGVRIGTSGYIEKIGGAFWSVALSTLDDLPVEMLVQAKVHMINGRDNDWFHEPREQRHL
jgi:hypothetical protein